MEFQTLHDWARRARDRAEELMVRSATVLARSGDLQVLLDPPPAVPAGPTELRERLVAAEARVANLERALVSNRRIGMALGILMARHGLTEQQAFDLLRQQSSRRNVKLAALAEEVVYTGDL
jgi:hypothetical protein